jgi:FkbM family methyltransferase
MPEMCQSHLKLAQLATTIYRFNTLRIADRLFSDASGILPRAFFGKTLYVDTGRGNPQRLLYLEGERFVAERKIVADLVRPGSIAIDVGANIGYYALMLAQYLNSSEIICIEPEPANLIELHRNIARNRLSNVTILPAAAAAEDGSASLLTGINGRIVPGGAGAMRVPTVTLNRFGDRRVGFVKIDVEGYELEVLRGATSLIRKQRPNLFVEVHPQFQMAADGVDSVLALLCKYYPNAVAYKKRTCSVFNKIGARYFGQATLAGCPVDSRFSSYPEIFWVACRGDDCIQ